MSVAFDARNSYSTHTSMANFTYRWNFGNDEDFDFTDAVVTYTFLSAGTFPVLLEITDKNGNTESTFINIKVQLPLTFNISITINGTDFQESPGWRVGDDISFFASTIDKNDYLIPESGYAWTVILHHCYFASCGESISCHEHALVSLSNTSSGTIQGVTHGYPAFISLYVTVTHPLYTGSTSNYLVKLSPEVTTIEVFSIPPGLQITSGSLECETPCNITVITFSTAQVEIQELQILHNKTYQFQNWSNGGAASQEVFALDAPIALTAYFTTKSISFLRNGSPNPPRNLVVTPGYKKVSLTWDFPSNSLGITYYKIYYRWIGNSTWNSLYVNNQQTSKDINGLQREYTYLVKMSSLNEVGEGEISATVNATTLRKPPIFEVDPCGKVSTELTQK